MKKPTFEECYDVIKQEINKRKNRWNLTSLSSIDYDDVSQIILIHIHKKWGQYNSSRPLKPWISRIIANQIRNLIRNNYTNHARPCLRCDAAIDNNGCKIWKEQSDVCPLYAYWKKYKEPANFIKIPLSIENHINEIKEIPDHTGYLFENEEKLHEVMKKILKPVEYEVYKDLYINHKSESEVAKKLGLITSEAGRAPGYKQIGNIIKSIISKAHNYVQEHGLE